MFLVVKEVKVTITGFTAAKKERVNGKGLYISERKHAVSL
jgi:hypothetical protein